jgi:hypothetical protein
MQEYHQKVQLPTLAQAKGRVHTHTINSLASHFSIKDMGVRRSNPVSGIQSPDQEYHAYINGDLWKEHSDPLVFWEVNNNHYTVVHCSISYLFTCNDLQSKCESYPTIFTITMDYLPIQASSIPCERVFSSRRLIQRSATESAQHSWRPFRCSSTTSGSIDSHFQMHILTNVICWRMIPTSQSSPLLCTPYLRTML